MLMNKGMGHYPLSILSMVSSSSKDVIPRLLASIQIQTFPWFKWSIIVSPEEMGLYSSLIKDDDRISLISSDELIHHESLYFPADISLILPVHPDIELQPRFIECGFWALYFCTDEPCIVIGDGTRKNTHFPLFFRTKSATENSNTSPKQTACEAYKHILEWTFQQNCLSITPSFYRIDNNSSTNKAAAMTIPEKTNLFFPIVPIQWQYRRFADHDSIHILLLAPWMQMGGADRFNLDLLRGLDQRNYKISVATTLADQNNWEDLFLAVTPDVFCLADFLDRKDFPTFLHYLIQSREIDVLMVSNSAYGYYMVPWLRTQIPDLIVVDYVHMPEKSWRSGGYARQSGYLARYLDRTYTCNNASRRQLIEEYHHDVDCVKTVYVGVDTDYFSPGNAGSPSVCDMLGIPENRPIVLFPCRMAPQKRPFLMLEIARQMKSKGTAPAFVAVGDGPDMDEMGLFIEENDLLDTVYLAGPQRDMLPFYRDACLTLVCSLYEGLALTVYESMAMETPVITSIVGGHAELVTLDTGILIPLFADEEKNIAARSFQQEEVDLYIRAIDRLLCDPQALRTMGQNARTRVLGGFTVEKMVNQFDEEFNALSCDRKSRGSEHLNQGASALLYEELAILAGEFAKRETVVLQQQTQLTALSAHQASSLPPPKSSHLWQWVEPLTNMVDHIPLLRMLLTRNRKP